MEDDPMEWQRIHSYITGSIDEELRIRNEYLAAENRILRSKIPGRVPLDDSDRATLAQIGKRLGLKALRDRSTFITERPDKYFGPTGLMIIGRMTGSSPGIPVSQAELARSNIRTLRAREPK